MLTEIGRIRCATAAIICTRNTFRYCQHVCTMHLHRRGASITVYMRCCTGSVRQDNLRILYGWWALLCLTGHATVISHCTMTYLAQSSTHMSGCLFKIHHTISSFVFHVIYTDVITQLLNRPSSKCVWPSKSHSTNPMLSTTTTSLQSTQQARVGKISISINWMHD